MPSYAADPRRSLGADAQQIVARVVNRISEASAKECGRGRDSRTQGPRGLFHRAAAGPFAVDRFVE
jgi:hypothetical protein